MVLVPHTRRNSLIGTLAGLIAQGVMGAQNRNAQAEQAQADRESRAAAAKAKNEHDAAMQTQRDQAAMNRVKWQQQEQMNRQTQKQQREPFVESAEMYDMYSHMGPAARAAAEGAPFYARESYEPMKRAGEALATNLPGMAKQATEGLDRRDRDEQMKGAMVHPGSFGVSPKAPEPRPVPTGIPGSPEVTTMQFPGGKEFVSGNEPAQPMGATDQELLKNLITGSSMHAMGSMREKQQIPHERGRAGSIHELGLENKTIPEDVRLGQIKGAGYIKAQEESAARLQAQRQADALARINLAASRRDAATNVKERNYWTRVHQEALNEYNMLRPHKRRGTRRPEMGTPEDIDYFGKDNPSLKRRGKRPDGPSGGSGAKDRAAGIAKLAKRLGAQDSWKNLSQEDVMKNAELYYDKGER